MDILLKIKNGIIFCLLLLMMVFALSPAFCSASSNQSDQNNRDNLHTEDRNKDGKPDLWGYYSPKGVLEKSEMDSNFDGVIDTWQEYENEKLFLVIRDTDDDGLKDTWDYYEEGAHIRQAWNRT